MVPRRATSRIRLTRRPLSATTTRYRITAAVAPHTRVMLVEPSTGRTVAEWRSGESNEVVRGCWTSSSPELIGAIDGIELDADPPQ